MASACHTQSRMKIAPALLIVSARCHPLATAENGLFIVPAVHHVK
jgi:hypothetical protein